LAAEGRGGGGGRRGGDRKGGGRGGKVGEDREEGTFLLPQAWEKHQKT
jgi:hypothetical protein